VRLSPKYRYGLDLIARLSGKTVSAVMEDLIRDRVGPALIDGTPTDRLNAEYFARALSNKDLVTGEVFVRTWDPRDCDRFINTALYVRRLMTEDEDLIWRMIEETPVFWRNDEIDRELVRVHWDAIQRAARKGAPSLRHLISKE
jgi:hypothetical protein